MNTLSPIKSFSVYGLFGTHDVHILFNENIKILIGENGLGKTQVLNIFYYILTQNFPRLSEFNFNRVQLTFSKGNSIEIHKNNIDELIKRLYKHPILEELINDIGFSRFELLRNEFIKSKGDWRRLDEKLLGSKIRKYPTHHVFRVLEELEMLNKEGSLGKVLDTCRKKIRSEIKDLKVLYFPTFRRVEEDLHNLGYDEDNLLDEEDTVIHFGMDDVSKRFRSIEHEIDQLLKEGFSKITSEFMSQLVNGFEGNDNSCLDKIDENGIDIILARVGNQLPKADKDNIRNIVMNKKITNPYSLYFLKKLIEIYEKQKELDNSIKTFKDVCNNYLIGKKVFYDESAIKIFIKSSLTNDEILLKYLSSGEKQIVSMFSKVYLSKEERFIVLFDEPELSLSMIWQKQLLPDVLKSKKCDFLLAVTHSPFIFENELDEYAIGLDQYITLSKNIIV
ncbi:MAG: AAA family ATPase [Methylococcaceae bacterium]